jgi:hypothetical protein
MKNDRWTTAGVLLLFVVITFFQLWPLPLDPGRSLYETIDSVLNTWTMTRVQQNLLSQPASIFEGNIFFPITRTLRFSELMLPQSLLGLPVYALTQNPLLAYNLLLFAFYVLNALAMFLLVRHLTRRNFAGVVSGLIFAFSTYQIQHITHLQLLSSWLVPLVFLSLHKFFESQKGKYAVWFVVFFVLQALACIYYGLFLMTILILGLPLFFLLNRSVWRPSLLVKLAVPVLAGGMPLVGFSLPYFSLFKDFDLKRELTAGADLINYLAVFYQNTFLGGRLSRLGSYEFYLCPGILALFLAGLYIYQKRSLFQATPKLVRRTFGFLIIGCVVLAVLISVFDGFSINLGFVTLSGHNLGKPVYFALVAIFFALLLSFIFYVRKTMDGPIEDRIVFLYLPLLGWALFLSFGGFFTFSGYTSTTLPLPFKWLHENVPGFRGVRVPSRYAVFVLFCTAILAGCGIKVLWDEIKSKNIRAYLAIGIVLWLNLEYLSIPQQKMRLPTKDDLPPTYLWLRDQPGDFAVIELPFHPFIGDDAIDMYFSLFHKKSLVNGYSGFIPPSLTYIRQAFQAFPSRACVDILQKLNIKYVILHWKQWKEDKAARVLQRIDEEGRDILRQVETFHYVFKTPNALGQELGDDSIYEVLPALSATETARSLVEVSPDQWGVTSEQRPDLLPFLKDGKLETAWTTDALKKTGDYLILQFKKSERIRQIRLYQGTYSRDYAIDLEVMAYSEGGWRKRAEPGYSAGDFAKNLAEKSRELVQTIDLDGEEIRSLKITQVGLDKQSYWSVAELKIFKSP